LKRGDIVSYAGQGGYGKPRPAVVVQSDRLPETESVLLCLITSDLDDVSLYRRILVAPSAANGLERTSQLMPEKLLAVRRARCRQIIGRLEPAIVEQLNAALALVIGLSDA